MRKVMVATTAPAGRDAAGPRMAALRSGDHIGVSGIDDPTGFDLRCQIREALVSYLQREHPEALLRSNRCSRSRHRRCDAVPNHSDPCCP